MIGWLESWLREIVLVVLFAVVTDMLLPNNTMQRYIKVVVSLFILLTILNPIITFIRSDFHFRDVEAEIDQWSSPTLASAVRAEQSDIAENAEKLRQLSAEQTDEWIEQRLSEMIREDLHEQGYEFVKQVLAQVQINPSGQAVISQVQVFMQQDPDRNLVSNGENKSESAAHQAGGELVEPIHPVDPVQPIRVEIDWSSRQAAEPAAVLKQVEQTETDGSVKRTIRGYLVEVWGVSPEQIVFPNGTR